MIILSNGFLMKRLLLILCLGFLLASCINVDLNNNIVLSTQEEVGFDSTLEVNADEVIEAVEPVLSSPVRPKIILFIGDGMGASHRTAGQYYSVGEVRQLAMDSLPVFGWLKTDSYGGEMTESAAGATALATGYQTKNDVVSLDIEGNELKTILEYAKEMGMSVGLVSTKYITDATTAAFGSHVENRSMRLEIALQFLENEIDVLFGGGENDFLPIGVAGCYPDQGQRLDERNLLDEASILGYTIICDQDGFESLDPEEHSQVIGLFADENMALSDTPSLADMTHMAIEILSTNPNGFFLVVEGAMIDIDSHLHNTLNVLEDVVAFDKAIKVGVDFAESEDEAMIIVTADHETGGMLIDLIPNGYYYEDGPFLMPNGTEFYISWLTGEHTAVNVPISALGKGTERFLGANENTIVFDVMLDFLGIQNKGE